MRVDTFQQVLCCLGAAGDGSGGDYTNLTNSLRCMFTYLW